MPPKKTAAAKSGGGDSSPKPFIFMTKNMSIQPNIDPDYEEVGIIHYTELSFLQLFGDVGLNNRYEQARATALTKVKDSLSKTQKVCNLRIEVTQEGQLVTATVYGTLLDKA